MPQLTQFERLLADKFKEIKAIQDLEKRELASASRKKAAATLSESGKLAIKTAKSLPSGPAKPLLINKGSGPAGETAHQKALRLLKAKQAQAQAKAAAAGSPAKGPTAASKGLVRRAPSGLTTESQLDGAREAKAPSNLLKRPSLKRPSLKRPSASSIPGNNLTANIGETAQDANCDEDGARPAKQMRSAGPDLNHATGRGEGCVIFVGDLPENTADMDLEAWFEALGPVLFARCCGAYGFVHFQDHETAKQVLAAAQENPIQIGYQTLRVNWARENQEGSKRGWQGGGRGGQGRRGGRGGGQGGRWRGDWGPQATRSDEACNAAGAFHAPQHQAEAGMDSSNQPNYGDSPTYDPGEPAAYEDSPRARPRQHPKVLEARKKGQELAMQGADSEQAGTASGDAERDVVVYDDF